MGVPQVQHFLFYSVPLSYFFQRAFGGKSGFSFAREKRYCRRCILKSRSTKVEWGVMRNRVLQKRQESENACQGEASASKQVRVLTPEDLLPSVSSTITRQVNKCSKKYLKYLQSPPAQSSTSNWLVARQGPSSVQPEHKAEGAVQLLPEYYLLHPFRDITKIKQLIFHGPGRLNSLYSHLGKNAFSSCLAETQSLCAPTVLRSQVSFALTI